MTEPLYMKRLSRVLDAMGGLYTLGDILAAIDDRRMQTFVVNNTWAVTQINQYPRARTLQVVALVGDIEDRDAIQAKLIDYASEVNAGLLSAYGRLGWIPHARELGWRLKAKSYLFHREM
jgi:hypothetical protein